MKKLSTSPEEKTKFIEDLTERLAWYNRGSLKDFKIDDLKEEYSKIPDDVKKPVILIEADTYVKMLELVKQSTVECSWHGLVKKSKKKGVYLIYDIIVFPQVNTATTTSTDEKEFAEWQMNLISDPSFPIEDLRMHGHSHVNMNVFSSSVDDKYQKDLLTKVEDGDYYIFIIMNKKMDICTLLYDMDQNILFENNDITLDILTNNKKPIRNWAKEELKDKCKEPKITTKKYTYWDENNMEWYNKNNAIINSAQKPIFKGGKNGFE